MMDPTAFVDIGTFMFFSAVYFIMCTFFVIFFYFFYSF